MTDAEVRSLQVEAWKTTIQVQQHFNDIEMKIRALAITLLTAVVGAGAVAIRDGTTIRLFSVRVHLAAGILAIGIFAWMLFYFVDQVWYHRLLIGAVAHGKTLEALLQAEVAGFGLSAAISDASPFQVRVFGREVGKPIHSTTKLRVFYYGVACLLIAAALLAQLGGLAATQARTGIPPAGSYPTVMPSARP